MTAFFRLCGRLFRSVGNYTTQGTNARHGGLFQTVKVLLACARIPHWAIRTIFAKNGRKDMAVLKIMNDIQDERQKNEARLWGEVEGVCYKDIDEFCESIPDDDPDIDIRLHCDGGQVYEGWAMSDRHRATGKNISVTV